MGRKIHQFCKLTVGCLVIFAFSNNSFTSELDEIVNANKTSFQKIALEIWDLAELGYLENQSSKLLSESSLY